MEADCGVTVVGDGGLGVSIFPGRGNLSGIGLRGTVGRGVVDLARGATVDFRDVFLGGRRRLRVLRFNGDSRNLLCVLGVVE